MANFTQEQNMRRGSDENSKGVLPSPLSGSAQFEIGMNMNAEGVG
jgi:hypothetical protein